MGPGAGAEILVVGRCPILDDQVGAGRRITGLPVAEADGAGGDVDPVARLVAPGAIKPLLPGQGGIGPQQADAQQADEQRQQPIPLALVPPSLALGVFVPKSNPCHFRA